MERDCLAAVAWSVISARGRLRLYMKSTLEKPAKVAKATTTKKKTGVVTQNPDGSFDITGKLAEQVQAAAKARGMSIKDYFDMSVSDFLAEQTMTKIPSGVHRLARQLNRDHRELAAEIMQAGVEALDNGIADQPIETFNPVCFIAQVVGYSHFKEFTITGWIERMSPELRTDCEKEARDCDQPLQQIVRERCMRGADLKQLAQPSVEEMIAAQA